MSITEQQQIPAGTWAVDTVHSSAAFAVRHMGIGTFAGRFKILDATIEDGVLKGTVPVASVDVPDENLTAHLLSPDFFDAERYPEITFVTSATRTEGDKLIVEGDFTIKGTTEPVVAVGSLAGPIDSGQGAKIGIDLATTVDRTKFGLNWNAPLPGGQRMLEDDVTLTVHLELVQKDA
jgi:polyisoprenoid-binding protein YceI